MALADDDTEALIKRRAVLDSTVMNMSKAGVAVPQELEEEFIAVQDELARRGKQALPEAPRSWTYWLGKDIGEYKIQYMIEEGLYWYLFHASGPSGDEVYGDGSAAIKIAKQVPLYGNESRTIRFATRLFAIAGDIVREVQPAQNVFAEAEATRLRATTNSALPVVGEESEIEGCRYFRTACPPGETLIERLTQLYAKEDAAKVIAVFSEIAAALDQLMADPSFVYHGNLKPENIVFTAGGVMFRELGDFCPLLCGESNIIEPEVRITTPQYYPWLDVDDIGALGICLWESLIGYHPFDERRPGTDTSILSPGLRELVDFELSLSNSFILPLLSLRRPGDTGLKISAHLEQVLFKSIKIRLGEDGLLYEDPGYQSMADFNGDLQALLGEGQLIG